MSQPRARIAVVNDDREFLALIERVVEAIGPYEASTFRVDETTVAEIRAADPALLIVDVLSPALPAGWELALLAGADRRLGDIPIVVTSPEMPGLGQRIDELRDIANIRVLSKPFTIDQLRDCIRAALPGTAPAEHGQREPI
jgi:DNA-binding NtrC family response regulator